MSRGLRADEKSVVSSEDMPSERIESDQVAAQPSSDQRAHPRHLVHERAAIVLLHNGRSFECEVQDLSLGGCRLHCDERLALEPGIKVEATLRVLGLPMRLRGSARWMDTCEGLERSGSFGIIFEQMSLRCQAILRQVMDELRWARRAIAEAKREQVELARRKHSSGKVLSGGLFRAAARGKVRSWNG